MGTFHHDRHELHGITVVVDTAGPKLYIGRCDDVTAGEVILLDVDVHDEVESGKSKAAYLARAAQVGFWKKLDRVVLERAQVTSLKRLGELAATS